MSIGQRPMAANKRLHYGHWEGHTVHGVAGSLVTFTDRKTRLLDAKKTHSRSKHEVSNRLIRMLNKHAVKTLTVDNGREFYGQKEVSESIN